MRFGSLPTVVISHPEILAQAFAKTELSDRWVTEPFFILTESENLAMAPYGDRWLQLHAFAMQELFSSDNLRMVREKHVEPTVNELVARMGEIGDSGELVYPHAMLDQSSFELTFLTFFGGHENDAPKFKVMMNALREDTDWANVAATSPNLADFIPWMRFMPSKVVREARRQKGIREEILTVLVDIVRDRRRVHPSAPACLVDVMLCKEELGENDRPMIHSLCTDLILAAYTGVAQTIKWFLLIVANRPKSQDEIHRELDRVVGPDRLPTVGDRERLPYTFACLAESMRYRTITPYQ